MTSDALDIDQLVVTGVAQQAAWQNREAPPVEQIGGDIWSIPVPFPDNPMRYTLTYVIPGDTGAVIVDPGWRSDDGWQALVDGLHTAGMAVGDVVGIVVTHVHPDHHGMSEQLRDASGAWVAMHPAERDSLPARTQQSNARQDSSRNRILLLMRAAATPEPDIQAFLRRFDQSGRPSLEDLIQPDIVLEDGELVPLTGRRLYALWTPGHTPGHLCLREPAAKVLLTGDCVLPRITPNLGAGSGSAVSPLRDFLASLGRIGQYDDYEALPAHEYRFRGLAARTNQLREHHNRRCREIIETVDELGTPTLWQLTERLTWSRPWPQVGRMQVAALSETVAHVTYLIEDGELAWSTPGGLADQAEPARLRRVR